MSINQVELYENCTKLLGSADYIPFRILQDGSERICFRSPLSRQSLRIKLNRTSPHPISITVNDGCLYLTTRRLVFVTGSSGDVDSFLIDLAFAPYLRLTHSLKSPWFGPNFWEFIFFSDAAFAMASDGFAKNEYFKGTIYFNEGGVFEFVKQFDKVMTDITLNSQVDEQLPRYNDIQGPVP